MGLLTALGFGCFFLVSLAVGLRLVLQWRRTRQLPELLIGIGVLGIGPVGFALPEGWAGAEALIDDLSGEVVGEVTGGRFEGALPARGTWVLRPQ